MVPTLKSTSLSIFLFFSLILVASAQIEEIKQTFESAADEGFSGVILIADQGEVMYENAVGFRSYEDQVPLESDDIFELASISKQFTSMLIMMCEEKGLLDFDDTLSKFIEVPYPDITIRQLLTHTSGLPDYQAIMDEHWDKDRVAGNPEILEYLRKYAPPKEFEPGEKYEYSNTGYVMLGSIVEKATGQDFVELSRNWIFKPLGMSNSDLRSLEAKAAVDNFAAGHLKNDQGVYVNANNFKFSDYTIWLGNRKGPGRVSSNLQDLLIWDQALYHNKLVSQETMNEAFSPQKLNDGTESMYGFGWGLDLETHPGKVVLHTGSNPGYKNIIVRNIDENKTIIILNNNAHPAMGELVKELRSIYFN